MTNVENDHMDHYGTMENIIKAFTQFLGQIRPEGFVVVCFDNEEIGSRTKQGAASNVLSMMIEKIFISLGYGREEFIDYILNGFMISADVAHGIHPCSPEKNDITNKPYHCRSPSFRSP